MQDPCKVQAEASPVEAKHDITTLFVGGWALHTMGVSEITLALQRMKTGEPRAADELMNLVYGELHRLAVSKMARESAAQTLQPTALVHEAWLRLGGDGQQEWENRAHFFGAAAEAMRRILIDHARRRRALRHGGGMVRVEEREAEQVAAAVQDEQLLAVHEALDRLAAVDPTKAELVKLRYFVGLSIPEAAQAMGISEATAKRWWAFVRAWLFQEIQTDLPASSESSPHSSHRGTGGRNQSAAS